MEHRKEKFADFPVVDENIVKRIPWAEEMRKILEEGLNKTFSYWCQMVENIGENEDVTKSWASIFVKTFEETCCELVYDMELLQDNVLCKIETLLREFQHLCSTLQITMPVLGDATKKLSLYQEQQELKKHIDKYKKIVEERQSELKMLLKKQTELCNMLGTEPKVVDDNPLPSEKIEEFRQHLEKLEGEKFDRLEKFLKLKEEMVEIVNELNVKPSSEFEKNVFSADDSLFLVTDGNMKELQTLHRNLIEQQTKIKEEIVHLRNKIDDYWNLLDIDLKEREDFRQKHSGNSLDVLQALRIEVKRCEDLKKANIKVFIDKLRNELEQLWGKCHCSQATRAQFRFWGSDCYTEDLLELYEFEVAKWKKYYEENKELLTLLEKHERLWHKMAELEENATGPNRYNNRGGQLLKEEKERNKLAKQIPQIEDMLYSLADRYKQHYNESFTIEGTPILDYLAHLHEDRENAKKQKLSARKMQREQALTPARSVQNLFPSTSRITPRAGTPHSTTKRKLATPATDDPKKPKVLSEKKPLKTSRTPVPHIQITSSTGRVKRVSVERLKRIKKIRRLSAKKEKDCIDRNETFVADYGQFQEELSTKEDCRSTILPSEATLFSTPMSSKTLRCTTPTPRTPGEKTPSNQRLRPRTPDTNNKFSAAKTNIKLIF